MFLLALSTTVYFGVTLAHTGTQSTPVPHWIVLVVGVVGLWVAIGGGVVVMDEFLGRFSNR